MFNIFRKEVAVISKTEGAYVNGFWIEGSEVTTTIKASVQPISGKDVELLPEGKRLNESFKLFTDSELKVSIEGTNQNGDIISIYESLYEVVGREIWQNNIINHRAYLISRIKND